MELLRVAHSEDKIDRFTAAIEELTLNRENRLQHDTEEQRQRMLKDAAERIRREHEDLFRERVGDLDAKISATRIAEINRLRNEVFLLREEYAATVFGEATSQIAAFVASDEYETFLLRLARTISETYDCSHIEVRLREDDLPLQWKLAQYFPATCLFVSSSEISLGGLIVWFPEHNLLLDERLEIRLEAEKGWFYENSGLKITW